MGGTKCRLTRSIGPIPTNFSASETYMNVKYADPLPLYVIHEEVYAGVFGVGKATIDGRTILGMTLDKIFRRVFQVMATKEVFQGGQKIAGVPGLWQVIKDAVGYQEFEERQTGERNYVLAYAGFINEVETFGARIQLPKITSPFTYGSDPIPQQKLVGNPAITFEVSNGGRGRVTAMAVYDAKRNRLNTLPRPNQDQVLKCLLQVPRKDGGPQLQQCL